MAYRYGDRKQKALFPQSIDEYIPQDAPVRAYDVFVDSLNLAELGIEGYGIDPDYDLDNEPHMLAKGCDQQLNKAIEVILKELKEKPVKFPSQPKFPDRSK